MEVVPNNRYWRQLALIWRIAWPVLRQVLGWMFILLGLLGLVLPVLQGVLFLVIGVALVGRRHWLIRRSSFGIKRGLRRWAAHPAPLIGQPGRLALRAQHQFSRQSRRLHRSLAERFRSRDPLAEPPREPPYEQA